MTRRRLFIALALAFGMLCGWFARDLAAFVRIDSCLDGGGAWNYQHEICTAP